MNLALISLAVHLSLTPLAAPSRFLTRPQLLTSPEFFPGGRNSSPTHHPCLMRVPL
jgi:hypothetical protein